MYTTDSKAKSNYSLDDWSREADASKGKAKKNKVVYSPASFPYSLAHKTAERDEYKVYPAPSHIKRLLRGREYIRFSSMGLTEMMYQMVDVDFLTSEKKYVPFLSMNQDGELSRCKIPERYAGDDWERFVYRMKKGREAEKIVAAWLERAGCNVDLLPMLIDGDRTDPSVDMLLYPKDLTDTKALPTGWDIKLHHHIHFTNNPVTFPKKLRVEKVRAYNLKQKWCNQKSVSYKGTIHFSVPSGSIIVVPNSSKDSWSVGADAQREDRGTDVYYCDSKCMKPVTELLSVYSTKYKSEGIKSEEG